MQEECLDQYYFLHSNKLLLLGLSPRHTAIVAHKTGKDKIKAVQFNESRTQNISGKRKSGAAKMDFFTIVCTIEMESGTTYKVRSFIKNVKMIEYNDRLVKMPELLADLPESDGFLAILMFNRLENPGHEDYVKGADSNENLIKNVFESQNLLSK